MGGRYPHSPGLLDAALRAGSLGPERLILVAMRCHPARMRVAANVDQLLEAAGVRAYRPVLCGYHYHKDIPECVAVGGSQGCFWLCCASIVHPTGDVQDSCGSVTRCYKQGVLSHNPGGQSLKSGCRHVGKGICNRAAG